MPTAQRLLSLVLLINTTTVPTRAQEPALGETVIRKVLAVGPALRGGRTLLHTDPIEAQIVAGRWSAPNAGDTVTLPSGNTMKWSEFSADKDGWFQGQPFSGGYAYASVSSPFECIMLLEATGHSMVYVNGEPRTGDPYGYGYTRLPVRLKSGANHLLFLTGRGRLTARLRPAPSPAMLDASDSTLPDLRVGERTKAWGAFVAINASETPLKDCVVECELPDGKTTRTLVPAVLPFGTRKIPFLIEGPAPSAPGSLEATVRLLRRERGSLRELHSVKVALRIREPQSTFKRTFISGIDGSVQYYAVNPATPGAKQKNSDARALVLTLHGASVEGLGQADAYAAKSWANIVAPTNRRPYGFDWEDWGRLDAMEVFGLAKQELKTDSRRSYLTGHSMGGHGTWQVGVQFPDQFAAIGPSAGWISFASYGGGRRIDNPSPIEEILQRSASPSDTLSLSKNYAAQGVYVLHGDADDNVPVTEARNMVKRLATFHHDYAIHEQPGAGHWWSIGDEPGARCVDWPAMFDLFARRRLPERGEVRQVSFRTANPEVTSSAFWATIEQQQKAMKVSSAELNFDPNLRRFSGTTENVAWLSLDVGHMKPGSPVKVELDGQKAIEIPWPAFGMKVRVARNGESWSVAEAAPASAKGPERSGPFKNAFNHRFLFVYGTNGTAEENAWALARARYDAEAFWYRGNGAVDVVADTAFDPKKELDRSVILYGNAETNGAWAALLPSSPVRVTRSGVRIGGKDINGADLACLFLQPRPGSRVASVGVVGGTGIAGMRLTERIPYFVSGVGVPDCVVMGPEALSKGAAGVRAAGFFGNDWSVDTGEFVFSGP
jgi:dienelactone hydrolase